MFKFTVILVSLFFFLFSFASASTFIFNNNTQLCSHPLTPCNISSPLIWNNNLIPSLNDSLFIYSNTSIFITVQDNVRIHHLTIVVPDGLFIIDGGELHIGTTGLGTVDLYTTVNTTLLHGGVLNVENQMIFVAEQLTMLDSSLLKSFSFTDPVDGYQNRL